MRTSKATAKHSIVSAVQFQKILSVQKKFPMIIFCYGDNIQLVEELYQSYLQQLEKQFSNFEEIRINGAESELNVLHAELCTIPMFNNNRLIWVRHADNMFERLDKKKDVLSKKTVQNFINDFDNVPLETAAFIHFDKKKIPTAFKSIDQNQFVIELQNLKEKDLPAFLRQKAVAAGYELEAGAEQLLIQKCAFDVKQSVRELDSLFLYCLKEKKIEVQDIQTFCSNLEGDLLYATLDLIAERKLSAAIAKFGQNKMDNTKDAMYFFRALARLFTDAFRYSYLHQFCQTAAEVQGRLGYRNNLDWLVRKNDQKFRRLLQLYHPQEISVILEHLYQLDGRLQENQNPQMQKQILFSFLFFLKNPVQIKKSLG